jgi:hypothetical protein
MILMLFTRGVTRAALIFFCTRELVEAGNGLWVEMESDR